MMKGIAHGCTVGDVSMDCSEGRPLIRLTPEISGLFNAQIHGSCVCNEMVSIRGRVVGDVPKPTKEAMNKLLAEAKTLARRMPLTKELTHEEFCSKYTGGKRTRYEAAAKRLTMEGLVRTDSFVSAFVKGEKFDPSAKVNPDPRMIQGRTPKYNVALGCYLRPIEHKVYTLKDGGLRVMGKGLTQVERAELLKTKWDTFNDPVCYAIDASRFDQHVSLEQLRIEHQFYKMLNPSVEFSEILKLQEFNKCFSRNGIRYKTRGKRMSGDMNTAVGNCLLMYLMCKVVMKQLGVHKYELLVDGDDTLLIVEQYDSIWLKLNMQAEFLKLGHEIKLEGEHTTLEGIVWCQSTMMELNPNEFAFVRPWRKTLSTLTCGTRYWNDPNVQKTFMHALGVCLLADQVGVPVLQTFALKLMSYGAHFRLFDGLDEYGIVYHILHRLGKEALLRIKPVEVSDCARASFAKTTGMTYEEQVLMEREIELWQPRFGETVARESEWSGGWNFVSHPYDELP